MDKFDPRRLVRKTYSLQDALFEVKKFAAISKIHDVVDLINENKLTGVIPSVAPHSYARVELDPQLMPINEDGGRSIMNLNIIEKKTIWTKGSEGFLTTKFSQIDLESGITLGVFQLGKDYYTDISYNDDDEAYPNPAFSWFTSADEILVTKESIIEYSKEFEEDYDSSKAKITNGSNKNRLSRANLSIEELFPSLPSQRATIESKLFKDVFEGFIEEKAGYPSDDDEAWIYFVKHPSKKYYAEFKDGKIVLPDGENWDKDSFKKLYQRYTKLSN